MSPISSKRRAILSTTVALLASLPAVPREAGSRPAVWAVAQDKKQDPQQAHPKVDQRQVDEAIKNGIAYLRTQLGNLPVHRVPCDRDVAADELVLWTLVHAGVPEDDPDFRRLFAKMVATKLERTYRVSLQAMILEEVDRVKWQWRIAQCAQFLADNQCANGQWGYGDFSRFIDDLPTPSGDPRKDTATGGGKSTSPDKDSDPSLPRASRKKPKVTKRIEIKKRKEEPAFGDNSNSQYAALGLRACVEAGIAFDRKFIEISQRWWRNSQKKASGKNKNVVTTTGAEPQGWCYGGEDHAHPAYGSMTAGAVGSLVIYDYLLAQDWKRDRDVLEGISWLAQNFSVTENVGPPEQSASTAWMYYYHLYALERAGVLFGTETIGKHEWYPEGANVLLDAQKSDGCWFSGHYSAVWDTCFAILFLRRATRPLKDVVTGDRSK